MKAPSPTGTRQASEIPRARRRLYSRIRQSGTLWAALGLISGAAFAQTPSPQPSPSADPNAAQTQLRGIEDLLRAGEAQQKKIQADMDAQRAEAARLTESLIEATAAAQTAERQLASDNLRLSTLDGNARALEASLAGRQALVAEILAALQRMGRNPPPAILLKPGDMAEAIRAATALGGVLPELRSETEALANDLDRLKGLRQGIEQERDATVKQAAALAEDRKLVAGMIEQRQAALVSATSALAAGQARNTDLAKQAGTLKELIAKALATSAEQQASDDIAAKAASLRSADTGRLKPAVAFAQSRGALLLPVTGSLLRAFGDSDGYGGAEKGLSLAAKPGTLVAAPMDASVLFAGPYRTYGQLLILNAGDGYNMVIAGLGRVNVLPGQFVLAGEPVATIGDGSVRSATAAAVGANEPILYIELRKDGVAVDPGPWFKKSEDEKARG